MTLQKPMTLADYRAIAIMLGGGEDNAAVKFFDDKIAKQGRDEKVLADYWQMILLIKSMISRG